MITLNGKNILIVDDEEMLREILIEEFSSHGATVVGAENGTKALELVRNQKFDVVISDVRMPGGDGLTLLHNINDQLAIKPKLFLCSGFNDASKSENEALGLVETFTKPFNIACLVQAVGESLAV